LFLKELAALEADGLAPTVYAHPNCLVTTFADMVINQRVEDARREKRHGSCGVGVHETVTRSKLPELKITMSDLWNGAPLESRLAETCGKYATFRSGKPIDKPEAMIAEFTKRCATVADLIHPLGIAQCQEPIFEGAQGLLLDQGNKQFFPHVTHSNTGMKNVRALCAQAGIADVDAYYVSRTYLTRHGAGPLPGEDARLTFEDATNVEHDYQGALRFAPLDHGALVKRCALDSGNNYNLVLTHCDQLGAPGTANYYFEGPTRDDIFIPKSVAA
jgi:adenylosuccinate synthase